MTEQFGNASSSDHIMGRQASEIVENARQSVSALVGARGKRVIFTSGATESANIVINSKTSAKKKKRFIISPLEHSAVLESCLAHHRAEKIDLDFVKVDSKGRHDLEDLERLLQRPADLVAIMAANNEIGNINPIKEIASLCQRYNADFLCDATQAAGKIEIDLEEQEITYLVLSAHKMYGPKGIGALICKKDALPQSLYSGGSQEYGVRSGTLNVPAIAGFGEACRLRKLEMVDDELEIGRKRNSLESLLKQRIAELEINGDVSSKLCGNLHFSVPGVLNDAVIARIGEKVCISRGASCSSAIEKPSHVLLAIKLSEASVDGAFRVSVGKFTTDDEIERGAAILIAEILNVRATIQEHQSKQWQRT